MSAFHGTGKSRRDAQPWTPCPLIRFPHTAARAVHPGPPRGAIYIDPNVKDALEVQNAKAHYWMGGSASGLSTVPSSFPAQPFFCPFSPRCVAFNRPLRSPSPDPLPAPAKSSEGRNNDAVAGNELECHPDASCSPSPSLPPYSALPQPLPSPISQSPSYLRGGLRQARSGPC